MNVWSDLAEGAGMLISVTIVDKSARGCAEDGESKHRN